MKLSNPRDDVCQAVFIEPRFQILKESSILGLLIGSADATVAIGFDTPHDFLDIAD